MTGPAGRSLTVPLVLSRSVLRPWRRGDEPALVRHADNHAVWRNLRDRFPHPYTHKDAKAWLALCREQDRPYNLAIEVGGEAAGGIGLLPQPDIYRHSAEVGYWLGEAHWGKGIASEALAAFTEYAFHSLGFRRLFATAFETNPASMRVLEKAGYEREGWLKRSVLKEGRVLDAALYAKLAPDL